MKHEVQEAIFHAGNTYLDPDKTPPLVIQKAWPAYMDQIPILRPDQIRGIFDRTPGMDP